ncbi:MAG: glutamate--cysteine ligase [Phycisphaerales bacterium]|nr:glutamate--cysteine ligase [Phycisphaerales bacterium]
MSAPYHLFQCYGVELEYMLVDRARLAVWPGADRLLAEEAGPGASDAERGALDWSNELVAHVIELKTAGPVPALAGLVEAFQEEVRYINERLAPHGACLLPTAMHPTMDPQRETRLWPHAYNEVYATFDRIFDCRGHGWANLQSAHLNLPFADDAEFGRLHAAVRVLLPILAALTASSPICEGRLTGFLDTRLEVYRHNARRVPRVSGQVIPEQAFTWQEYMERILAPLYEDLAPHDPEGVLRYEWINARGAIARFDRQTIELRVLDTQECPAADLAVLDFIVRVLRDLVAERWAPLDLLQNWEVAPLAELFLATLRDAGATPLRTPGYAELFGLDHASAPTVGALWTHLFEAVYPAAERVAPACAPLRVILSEGCLAARIRRALGAAPDGAMIDAVYRRLAECLQTGSVFQ